MFQVLLQMEKEVEIICADPPSDEFSFLPEIEKIQVDEPSLNYDAYLILDAGATHLTGFHESHSSLFDKSLEVINIDHHQSNDFYGKYNVVIEDAASTTAVLYEIFQTLNYPIDRHIATCLLTGIYTDTGSFMHSNTSSDVLRVASRLLNKGANLREISKEIFNTTKISTMRLWGRVLRNAHQNGEGVTMSVVTRKDFEDTGADYSEMTGVVDYINSVPGAHYSVILTEREDKVKGSLRTLREEVDVADIAAGFGGGGHTKAAGFTIPGRLQKEIRWKVVN
jgi:phosphoesterase RecJ-like protein